MKKIICMFWVAISAVTLGQMDAFAACTTPSGSEGQLRYDTGTKQVYVCDNVAWNTIGGSTWVSMSTADTTTKFDANCMYKFTTAGWTAGTGMTSNLVYNPNAAVSAIYATHGTLYYYINYNAKTVINNCAISTGACGATLPTLSIYKLCF